MFFIRFIFILFITSIAHADNYQTITITDPINNFVYQNNESGTVDVRVKLSADLQSNNKLLILLDNKTILITTSCIMILKNIDRGEHHLQIQMINKTGRILTSSNTIIFYMHRPVVRKL